MLGHREDHGRHAVVYLDCHDRIAVDVHTPPAVASPFLYRCNRYDGLDSIEIDLQMRARLLARALARSLPDHVIQGRWERFMAGPWALPPPESSPGARSLHAIYHEVRTTYALYQRDLAFRTAAVAALPQAQQMQT